MAGSDNVWAFSGRRRLSWMLAFVFLLSAWGGRGHVARGAVDRGAVAAFTDQFIPRQLVEHHVPGAVFVFVQDGKVLFSRGYGLADLEAHERFDPDRTIIPIGSLSKPVTATAVMQLYERSRVRLDADVNIYLKDMRLEKIGRAVTLHDLLTHSAGFDPIYVDIATRDPEAVPALGEYLPAHVPPRSAPGVIAIYSNYGYALAGLIVESVSGQPFERYMDSHVFEPLHMDSSTFSATEPPRGNPAVGYDWRGGEFVALPPLHVYETPSAGMSSTASDLAKFMIAQVQDGQCGDIQLLYPATVKFMHRTQFTHHPALPGWTYGFSEGELNGRRTLEHGGVWNGFTCKMLLIPGEHAGFFVAYNRFDPALRDAITRPLVDRLFPDMRTHADVSTYADASISGGASGGADAKAQAADIIASGSGAAGIDVAKLAGSYRSAWYSHGTLEKLRILWKPRNVIHANADGSINLIEPGKGSSRFVAAGPLLFRSPDGRRAIAFRVDGSGRVTHLLVGIGAFERARWWELTSVHLMLFGVFLAVFAMSMVLASWRWIRARGHYEFASARIRLAIAVCSAINVLFLLGLAVLILHANNREMIYGLSIPTAALLRLPEIMIVLTIATIALSAAEWLGRRHPHGRRGQRLQHALFAMAATLFVPFLAYWHLLRF